MNKDIRKKMLLNTIISVLLTAIVLVFVYFAFLKPQNNVQVIENTEPTNETKEETKKEDSSNQESTKEEIKDSLDEEDTGLSC